MLEKYARAMRPLLLSSSAFQQFFGIMHVTLNFLATFMAVNELKYVCKCFNFGLPNLGYALIPFMRNMTPKRNNYSCTIF